MELLGARGQVNQAGGGLLVLRPCSSELRDDEDLSFLPGDGGLFGTLDCFHCAAWEGRVTVAVTVLVCCVWRATLKRFGRLVLCASCDVAAVMPYDVS